jgi:hypothetical protein
VLQMVTNLNGTVQRKITAVAILYQSRGLSFELTADIFLLKLNGIYSLNCKNRFQRLKPEYVAYPVQ